MDSTIKFFLAMHTHKSFLMVDSNRRLISYPQGVFLASWPFKHLPVALLQYNTREFVNSDNKFRMVVHDMCGK